MKKYYNTFLIVISCVAAIGIVVVLLLMFRKQEKPEIVSNVNNNVQTETNNVVSKSTEKVENVEDLVQTACKPYEDKQTWYNECIKITREASIYRDAAAKENKRELLNSEIANNLAKSIDLLFENTEFSNNFFSENGAWCNKVVPTLPDVTEFKQLFFIDKIENVDDGQIVFRLYDTAISQISNAYKNFLQTCDVDTTCYWFCLPRFSEEFENFSNLLINGKLKINSYDKLFNAITYIERIDKTKNIVLDEAYKLLNYKHPEDMTLAKLKRDLVNYEEKSVFVRLFVSPSNYYNYNFSSARKWKAYELYDENSLVNIPIMYGYVDRKNSSLVSFADSIDIIYNRISVPVAVTVELYVPKNQSETSLDHVQIVRMCPAFVPNRIVRNNCSYSTAQ